jgi:thioester reductase-like protein
MKRVIVNGANGYVASNFINELLKHHYQVLALVRGNTKSSAEDRVIQALNVINDGNTPSLDNLMIVDYSLLDKNFGLSETRLQELFKTEQNPYIEPNFYCDRMKVCSQTSWACPEEREDGIEF